MTEAELERRCKEVLTEIEAKLAKTTDAATRQRWLHVQAKWRMLLFREGPP